jgi:predicted CXXCH cytochrome family protein
MSQPGFVVAACLLALWGTTALSRQVPAFGQATADRRAPAAPGTIDPAARQPAIPVGAGACATCHADKHAAWTRGRHSKMLQPAKASTALGDFTQARLTLHGKPYRLRTANGALYITESSLTGKPVEHRVDYTLGSRRIQHYLTTIDRGRIVVLPPSWDVQRREWFDNMDIIRPDEEAGAPVQQWNKNCVGCHVSQQDNHYTPATRTYATAWVDFGTSCERCHGPGSAHVGRETSTGPAPAGAAIVRPTRLDPPASSMVCAQCHSLRDLVASGYRAGENYYDYFVPKLEYTPRKEQDPVYWADGRPRRFSNDAIGLWQSRCFLKGGATCTTCHDAHFPDVDRHPELAASNNALCTSCHAPIASALAEHTRHLPASAGSSCVECHMPRTVLSIKARIRDHSISLPTPENTVSFGIPNACTECHSTRPASWAVEVLAKWRPTGRRTLVVDRAAAFTAARSGKPEALPRLLAIAGDIDQGPLMQANALGYLRNYSDPRAQSTLTQALGAEHPLLRMVAASSLRGPGAQASLLRALDDSRRAVRLSALVSLVNGGVRPPAADRARFARVSAEFVELAKMHEDDQVTQADLGLVHLLNDDLDRASQALMNSRALDPAGARSAFLLGLVRLGQRRLDEARALFEQVPSSDPFHAAARRQLQDIRRQQ